MDPQGNLNIPTFTKSLEKVFRDFDANAALPRGLEKTGEAIAAFNQIYNPFRSSGTAENAAAGALTGISAGEPSSILKILTGLTAPFAGGGTGGLLGGGVGRAGAGLLQERLQEI